MNGLDIFITVVLVVAAFFGWRRGIIGTVLTLVGLVVGVVVAGQTYDGLSNVFDEFIDSPTWANVAAFATVLVVILAASMVLSRLLKKALTLLMLGWVDNVAGMVLGLFMSSLGLTAVIGVMGVVPFGSLEETVESSVLAGFFGDAFLPGVLALLPSEFDRVTDLVQ
ncbi:MAG: CvpA family protein [Chloroflexi bacterium]|nr:CvpA family protein [Chloroflexota bacterium]